MSPLVVVVVILVAAGLFFGLNRLSARTAREITIPFASRDLPASEVSAALERMGCVVSHPTGDEITAFTPSDALSFGQIMTVKLENGGLRVRSSFSDAQVWRGSKNQENIDRFKKEWDRRAEFKAAADPAVRAAAEASAGRAFGSRPRGQLAALEGAGLDLEGTVGPRCATLLRAGYKLEIEEATTLAAAATRSHVNRPASGRDLPGRVTRTARAPFPPTSGSASRGRPRARRGVGARAPLCGRMPQFAPIRYPADKWRGLLH